MLYREELERAFESKDPVAALRSIALQLHAEGKTKQEIYNIFFQYYQFLQAAEREMEEHLLGDVMDMITGEFTPFNLNFPDRN